LKVTQGHLNCGYLICYTSLAVSDL